MLNHQLGHERGHETSSSRGFNTNYAGGNQHQGVFSVGGNLPGLHNMSGSFGLPNTLPQNRGLGNLGGNSTQGQQSRYGGQNLAGNLQQQYSQVANRSGLPLANGLSSQGMNRGNPGTANKQGQRLQGSVMPSLGNLSQNMQRSNTQGLSNMNSLNQRNLQSMGLGGGQYGMHHLGSPARSSLGLNNFGNPSGPGSHTSSPAPNELLSIIGKGNNQGGLGGLGQQGQAFNQGQHQPQAGSVQSNAGGSQTSTQEKEQPGLSFDASDFPALGGGGRAANLKFANGDRPSSIDGTNHQLYSNLNLHKGMLPSEFNIQQEEFPALPGSGPTTRTQTEDRHANEQSAQLANLRPEQSGRQDWSRGDGSSASAFAQSQQGQSRFAQSNGFNAGQSSPAPSQASNRTFAGLRRPGGPSRQQEQEDGRYALKGLLGVMNMKDHDLTMIALGLDLTALGLPLNSLDVVYKTFDHPLADKPLSSGPEFQVPECYKRTAPKLKAGYFTKFQLETLFYIFYSMPGNEAQVFAGDELSVRGWLFHIELQAWLKKDPSVEPTMKTAQSEVCRCQIWDPKAWKMVTKEMNISYAQIERAPGLKR